MILLDYLRVPMAAPETPLLRTMRSAILALCALLVLVVVAVQVLHRDGIVALAVRAGVDPATAGLLTTAAIGAAAGSLVVLVGLVPVYLRIKNRADNLHLDAMLALGGEA